MKTRAEKTGLFLNGKREDVAKKMVLENGVLR